MFPKWLEMKLKDLEHQYPDKISKQLRALSWGPDRRVQHYKRCIINGYRFHTKDYEVSRKTQNSGVVVRAEHERNEIDFFGVLNDILEFEYQGGNKIVLFKCDWWNLESKRGIPGICKDNYDLTSVNTTSLWYKDQPYILAIQAAQCYYVPDIKLGKSWQLVIRNTPRDNFDFPNGNEDELEGENDPYQQLVGNDINISLEVDDSDIELRRLEMAVNDDVAALFEDIPSEDSENCEENQVFLDEDDNVFT